MGDMVNNLRAAILEADFEYFLASAPGLLFWVLFIGSAAAAGHVSRTWYLTRLASVGQHLQLSSWEDMKSLLKGFYYVDQVLDTPMKALWDEALLGT